MKQGPGAAPHQAGPRSAGVILEELGVFSWAPHLRSSDLCGSAEAFRSRRRLHLPVPEGRREASSQPEVWEGEDRTLRRACRTQPAGRWVTSVIPGKAQNAERDTTCLFFL